MNYLFPLLFLISVIFEGTLTTFPVTLLFLLSFSVVFQKKNIFLWAFISGLLLDALNFRMLGTTSLFFIIFLFFVFLYERKYEINTLPFIMIASFFGSLLYLKLLGYHHIVIQSGLASVVGGIVFLGIRQMNKQKKGNRRFKFSY